MAKSDTSDSLVAEGREAFELCQDAEKHNRDTALEDIKFARLSEQWPGDIRKQREREGRPCLTINKLPAFIRQVVNDARQNKPSIHVHPVDSGADKKTADILSQKTDVTQQSALDALRQRCVDNGIPTDAIDSLPDAPERTASFRRAG